MNTLTAAETVFERVRTGESDAQGLPGEVGAEDFGDVAPSENTLDIMFDDGSVLAVWTLPVDDFEEPDQEEVDEIDAGTDIVPKSGELTLAEQALELLKVSPEHVLGNAQPRTWGKVQRRYLQFDESAVEYVFPDNSTLVFNAMDEESWKQAHSQS